MRLIVIISIVLSSYLCKAQKVDAISKVEIADSVVVKNKKRNPNRAALLSAICPGLGQAYNRSYWKMPIVYAAVGGSIYGIIINQKNFNEISAVYKRRINKDSTGNLMPELGSNDAVLYQLNYYRRWRDLSYILVTASYLLNIIEAHVDAHLKDFDVSDNLSMKIKPSIFQAQGLVIPGFSLSFRVKEKRKFQKISSLE